MEVRLVISGLPSQAAFELADGELADVLAAMRADVQSDETPVARRALSLFVRRVDVDADRIW
ncbi:MAG: hypothetical protein WCI74_21990 [Actinomycetes bacterium]